MYPYSGARSVVTLRSATVKSLKWSARPWLKWYMATLWSLISRYRRCFGLFFPPYADSFRWHLNFLGCLSVQCRSTKDFFSFVRSIGWPAQRAGKTKRRCSKSGIRSYIFAETGCCKDTAIGGDKKICGIPLFYN